MGAEDHDEMEDSHWMASMRVAFSARNELLWVPVGACHSWMRSSLLRTTKPAPPSSIPPRTEPSTMINGMLLTERRSWSQNLGIEMEKLSAAPVFQILVICHHVMKMVWWWSSAGGRWAHSSAIRMDMAWKNLPDWFNWSRADKAGDGSGHLQLYSIAFAGGGSWQPRCKGCSWVFKQAMHNCDVDLTTVRRSPGRSSESPEKVDAIGHALLRWTADRPWHQRK